MSIPNLFNKIKSSIGIDNMDIIYSIIIITVGIASFFLGRLSIHEINTSGKLGDVENNVRTKSSEFEISTINKEEKRYVASKNGKMYYSLGCSGAKRIKQENEIWFSSKDEAENSGYQESSACK